MDEQRYRSAEHALWANLGVQPVERSVPLARWGTNVRVQEVGDGQPVLFVHGGSASGANWAPLVARLDEVRCLLLDRPGCGLSPPLEGFPTRDLTEFLDATDGFVGEVLDGLDLPSAPVVATSLGALFAFRGAAAMPDRVETLVTYGYVFGAELEHLPLSMRLATLPGVGRVMTSLPPTRSAVKAILRQLGLGPALEDGRLTPEMVDWFLALLRHTPTMRNESRAPRELLPPTGLLPSLLLESIRCPVHLAWPRTDPIGGEGVARRFAAALPAARLDVWDEGSHAPWFDDPERAAQFLRDALSR